MEAVTFYTFKTVHVDIVQTYIGPPMHLKLLYIIVLSLISGFKKHLPCSQTDEVFPEVIVHQLTNHHELRKKTITIHNLY